ncbi:PhzF family phenazine biosynthesis protein [Rhodoferax sp. AJA081-3]|uniref:PhzF family phenazine biosynthesis protein n=1 Tax=Rhodoferax sp. AJA081-3 TaxID=2752316 RepID=UPI001AE02F1C|nr:PhzF family phenazine biosynthesis protein [Rhodoferax sp. AJA081-3]QTN30298.1 PhzF family phenazine biosynthesis protein [Rhodoferax sp. AJA081-3]
MQQRPFKQVDVFTAQAYRGNPLAVVLDGTGLSTEDMQQFARWTNLSETTFLLPPTPEAAAEGADYQVRIFTPGYEMPFAGHPTLGSCHAWLEHGGVPKTPGLVVQQCKVGLIRINQAGGRPAFAAPALKRSDATPELVAALADALGLPLAHIVASQHLNNGPTHFGILVDDLTVLLGLSPDAVQLNTVLSGAGISGVGVAMVQPADDAAGPGTALIGRSNREARAFVGGGGTSSSAAVDEPTVEVRFFFDHGKGVGEDPVTGSFNASLAQWLIATRHAPAQYVAAQGTCLGVLGRVHIRQDADGQVWVGGDAVTCINGSVLL